MATESLTRLLAPRDRHVRRSGDDYAQAFLRLLPTGQAWPRSTESTLVQVCEGLCDYYGYVDSRAGDLLERESDPRATIELLPDWEKAWGLPDPCFPPGNRVDETLGQNNYLDNNWDVLFNSQVTPTTDGGHTLAELGSNSVHYCQQYIAGLPVGKYRVSISWRPVGTAPRGIFFAIEGNEKSGAAIWVNEDGTINDLKTGSWGFGIALSEAKNTIDENTGWRATSYTLEVSAAGRFTSCELYLVGNGDTTYQGLANGTG